MLGRYQKMSVAELNNLGVCGLLHDMGKMKVPLEILNKPGKLSADEMHLMKKHTTWGRDIIMSARGVFSGAVDVAFGHHEHLDGTGYPRGVKASGITNYTRIIAIVDAYDAITSNRIYQKGRLHLEAVNILTMARNSHFDSHFVIQFIDCIGIYPVGNLVEMTNGEVGVVIEKNSENKARPKILLLLDSQKQPQQNRTIDMASEAKDPAGDVYRIYKVLHSDDFGVDLKKIHEAGGFNHI
jgi:HD-GYP domain-containing protein (c-di-GMP phosphodiesterase class II)